MQGIPFSEFQKHRKNYQTSFSNTNIEPTNSINNSVSEEVLLDEDEEAVEQDLEQNIEQYEKDLIEEEEDDNYPLENSYHISNYSLPPQQTDYLLNNKQVKSSPSKKLKDLPKVTDSNQNSSLESIPADIQLKMTSKVREDLTQIVQNELMKVKSESEKELLKIRQEVTSHSSSEVDRKVRQAVDAERQKLEVEFGKKQQQIYTQAVRDTEKKLQQDYENRLRQALNNHEEQVKSRLQKQIEADLLNKFETEFEKEIQKMQLDNANNLQLLKEQLNQQLLSQREVIRKEVLVELQEQQKKEALLNRSNYVDEADSIKSGLDSSFSIADLTDEPNKDDSTLWINNEFDAKDIATKLIQDAKVGKTLNSSGSNNSQSGGLQQTKANFTTVPLSYNNAPSFPSFPLPNTLPIQSNNFTMPGNFSIATQGGLSMPQNPISINRSTTPFQNQFMPVPQFTSVIDGNTFGPNFGTAYGISDFGSPKRIEASSRSKSARVKTEKSKQEEVKIVKPKREGAGSIYETLLMNKQLQSNKPSPSNPTSKSKDGKSTTTAVVKPFNNQALQQKEILINHWRNNESSYYQKFSEQQKNLERFFSSSNNSVVQRLNSMFQWLYNYWGQLEISFQYRSDFLESKIIQVIQSNSKNLDPMLQICEQNLSLEINKLNFDSQLTSAVVTLISRRESLKVKLNELNTNKSNKNSADKIPITNEIKQLAKQIRTSIVQWEENYKKDMMYRGIRYLDILEYDRLVAEKQEFENDMQDIQKRVKKFAIA